MLQKTFAATKQAACWRCVKTFENFLEYVTSLRIKHTSYGPCKTCYVVITTYYMFLMTFHKQILLDSDRGAIYLFIFFAMHSITTTRFFKVNQEKIHTSVMFTAKKRPNLSFCSKPRVDD